MIKRLPSFLEVVALPAVALSRLSAFWFDLRWSWMPLADQRWALSIVTAFSLNTTSVLAYEAIARADKEASSVSRTSTISTTPLVRLINRPEAFHRKRVRVIAYLHIEFEGQALYLSVGDFQNGISSHGLWLANPEACSSQALQDRYVLVEGTVDADYKGHMGSFVATIKDISRCELWSDPREPRRR